MKLLSETNLSSDWMRKIELQERELNDLSVVDRLKGVSVRKRIRQGFDLGWWADRENGRASWISGRRKLRCEAYKAEKQVKELSEGKRKVEEGLLYWERAEEGRIEAR